MFNCYLMERRYVSITVRLHNAQLDRFLRYLNTVKNMELFVAKKKNEEDIWFEIWSLLLLSADINYPVEIIGLYIIFIYSLNAVTRVNLLFYDKSSREWRSV